MQFKYVQIGAKNLDVLVNFYKKALDFKESKEKPWIDKGGVMLEAPGFSDGNAPLFYFYQSQNGKAREINDRGFAHICFETIDVNGAIKRFVKYGGSFYSTLKNPYKAPCVYCKDIEGNVVEFHIPFPAFGTLKEYALTLSTLLQLKRDQGIRKENGNSKLRFIHVNIITEDWRKLCDFYNEAFGSSDFGKIKDHEGNFKEQVIGVKGVHVIGKHVLLPSFYDTYPTLEIFTYSIKGTDKVSSLDEQGLNCIGFKSNDLEKDIKLIEEKGGKLTKRINDNLVQIEDFQGSIILLSK